MSLNRPLLVFADDWGRHPSSCQHLVNHLLPERETLWVNTIGTRTPRLDLATLRRASGKLLEWVQPRRVDPGATAFHCPEGLRVTSPKMWPWFSRSHDRWLNRKLLTRHLVPLINEMEEPPTAITTLPIVADLMPLLPVRSWVYYCVDDFSRWPGLDQKSMARMEREVIDRADRIVAVSRKLQDRIAGFGRESDLLTHGVDYDFWKHPEGVPSSWLAGKLSAGNAARLTGRLVVFWGVIDPRMDTGFVVELSRSLGTSATIVLAGPQQDADPGLFRLPNVAKTGPLPFADLPKLAALADVLVMPYVDAPVTRAMQPLKLAEYLATGKPAVVRDLPANREWSHALDLASSAEGFAEAVKMRLRDGIDPKQVVARERLRLEGWEAKAKELHEWLEVIPNRPMLRSTSEIVLEI